MDPILRRLTDRMMHIVEALAQEAINKDATSMITIPCCQGGMRVAFTMAHAPARNQPCIEAILLAITHMHA